MIDGEALWTSRKVRKLPDKFRLHYAWWLPLAEANGVFEADPDLIWSKIYAFVLHDLSVEEVRQILNEFVKVDLVRTWEEKGKTWGYFTGISKEGRLPGPSQLPRYKNLPPAPPTDLVAKPRESYVYFARGGPYVKIGFSTNINGRIDTIRNAAPFAVEIAGLMVGDQSLETELHRKFKTHRVNREWFNWCEEIECFVRDNAASKMVLDCVSESCADTPIQTNPITEPDTNQTTGDEGVNTPLRVEKDIRELVRVHFPGPPPETLTSEQRKALRAKADQFGHHALPGLFDAWAAGQETAHRRPISVFLGYEPKKSEIDALEASTSKSPVSKDELKKCLLAIAKASGGADGVVIGPRYHAAISEALAEYGHETVLQAFKTFWANFSGEKKWAELDFSGKVVLQCELALESKREAEQLNETMAAARKELETMPLLAAQNEEDESVEEI